MAAYEGEERLLTVFADVHYYFSAPSPRPLQHRFDKGSYLYLFGNTNGSGGRLEVANHVGKPEQDAFTGGLDQVTIRQSFKHPSLCTVTVEGFKGHGQSMRSPVRNPEHYWKLPNTDPRNERNLLLHLHTLDIYFWTVQDAESFLECAKKILQRDQLEYVDVPPAAAPHEKAMSPVVQQLENVAIQDPAYHNGQTRSSRTTSTPFSPIPTTEVTSPKAEDAASFKPLAYNPAAPAAPEPIKHREKTPPPVDADTGTGLAAAAYADHAQAVSPPGSLSRPPYSTSTSTQGYVGSPPAQPFGISVTSPSSGGYSNVPSATGHRTSSVSSFPPAPAQSTASPHSAVPSFAAPPQSPGVAASPSSQALVPAFSPPPREHVPPQQRQGDLPLESPSAAIMGNSYVGGVKQPLQHLQPQYADYLASGHQAEAPIGGYSNYSYAEQPQHGHHHHGNEYDVHSQVYRPTEEEMRKGKRKPAKADADQQPGKLEQGASQIDKKVNRFFKKIEKKIG